MKEMEEISFLRAHLFQLEGKREERDGAAHNFCDLSKLRVEGSRKGLSPHLHSFNLNAIQEEFLVPVQSK